MRVHFLVVWAQEFIVVIWVIFHIAIGARHHHPELSSELLWEALHNILFKVNLVRLMHKISINTEILLQINIILAIFGLLVSFKLHFDKFWAIVEVEIFGFTHGAGFYEDCWTRGEAVYCQVGFSTNLDGAKKLMSRHNLTWGTGFGELEGFECILPRILLRHFNTLLNIVYFSLIYFFGCRLVCVVFGDVFNILRLKYF